MGVAGPKDLSRLPLAAQVNWLEGRVTKSLTSAGCGMLVWQARSLMQLPEGGTH